MRAILIDPEKQTLTEIQMEGEGIEEIYTLLGGRKITASGRSLKGNMVDGFDHILVSDDYMEDRDADSLRFWFQVDADRNPPSSYPIAGRGLACGVDEEGGRTDLRISVAELTKRITFTQRKFRGFNVRKDIPDAHIAIEPVVPLIDGANEEGR